MSFIPSLCTDTRLPQNLRDVCDDIWRNVPKPERRPIELPRAEWRGELRDWRECIAITDHNEPVFLTYFGGLDEVSGRMDGSQEGEMVFELIFHDHNRCTLSDTPALGSDIYVSALDQQDDLWMTLTFACWQQLSGGPAQSNKWIEETGLTLTDNFVSEASYWVKCRVRDVRSEDSTLTILAVIESVVWNASLHTGMSEVLAAGNQRAREARRISTSDPQAQNEHWLELERKLTDSDWEVRWSSIYGKQDKLTPEQIDRAQRDKKRMVRYAIAKRFDLELDPAQIEVGLTDQSVDVRDIYSYRGGYTLTPEQIERGLTDESGLIRLRIATRPDVVGRLTAMQIERGLADDCEEVRSTFAGLDACQAVIGK